MLEVVFSCYLGFLVSPEIDERPNIAKSAASMHTDGVLICEMTAYPEPTITWSKGGTDITLSDDKYTQTKETEGQIKFRFSLTVKSVKEADYGTYKCKATNDKGSDSHDIQLGGTSEWTTPNIVIWLS